ncbi:hypothetical protein [Polyangium jinanense]|uniref:Uncharacterized protein n=1 Tax=Polyangium jinanense TaxID=2829994 RepID=A0A9X3X671_9BACT|nr:hypothetical protein [Polyangium jinanense]MDC3956016.1 hypothetical protein [Polyangium jinanense]MDC3982953.1 hypothetical protein [Polyangium jinanense]MDC3986376.1 hypothetical protein [Polyangium jinanense]
MPLDTATIAPKARQEYLRIGKQFGSTDTLNQANKTLEALHKYAPALQKHGFNTADGARLSDARDALIAAGIGRVGVAGQRKLTNKGFVTALKEGKSARETARSVLHAGRNDLEEKGDEASADVIAVALDQTRAAQDDAEKLAVQLDTLRDVLKREDVTAVVHDRGGPDAITRLGIAADALRAAAKEREGQGTMAATEHLDLIDGIVVTLARSARKAARAAARETKQPALAAAFELTHLYGTRGERSQAPEEPSSAPG